MTVDLYDPLTYQNLMMGLIVHFEKQEMFKLDGAEIESIAGPGIYSLYYSGLLEVYRPISGGNWLSYSSPSDAYQTISGEDRPIYVGKAVPSGSRKGEELDVAAPKIRQRINEHFKSIDQVNNLDVSDFYVRALAVVPVWITLAERFLIDHYRPVWNVCLDGFGAHDPGSGRSQGERSWWDTLHPGRSWARKLRVVKSEHAAAERVERFFRM